MCSKSASRPITEKTQKAASLSIASLADDNEIFSANLDSRLWVCMSLFGVQIFFASLGAQE